MSTDVSEALTPFFFFFLTHDTVFYFSLVVMQVRRALANPR